MSNVPTQAITKGASSVAVSGNCATTNIATGSVGGKSSGVVTTNSFADSISCENMTRVMRPSMPPVLSSDSGLREGLLGGPRFLVCLMINL